MMPPEDNVKYLISALSIEEEDILTCSDCEERLPDYLQAETNGSLDEQTWPAVRLHLKVCPYCAGVYEELKALLALAQGERGREPPASPIPNLSFLPGNHVETAPPARQSFWRPDTLGRRLIEFSTELLQTWQPPATMAAGVKKRRTEKILYQLDWQDSDKAIQASITIEQQRDDPAHCLILIEIKIPGRTGWPELGGMEVILKHEDRFIQTESTNAFGQVVFQGIAVEKLPGLVFEVGLLS